jgi:uncharacterized protein
MHRSHDVTQHVLFVHGGGEGAHAADEKLAQSLRQALGEGYTVIHPQMPNEDAPEYAAWKDQILRELAALDGKVMAAGHSLGASVWLKVLAEESLTDKIAGIFLVAAPYWGAEDWEVDDYKLHDDFAAKIPKVPIYLYHSTDDAVVPFEHMAMYWQKLPKANVRIMNGRDHQLNNDLSAVAADMLQLP